MDDNFELEPIDDIPRVAASEKDLLDMAQAVIAPHTVDVWGVLCRTRKLPPHISETCAWLLGDTLSKVWHHLWRRGGTEPGASLEAGAVKRGRVWQRHPATPLEFTAATMRLLRWLVQTQFPVASEKLAAQPLSIGDQVMVYLTLDAAIGTPAFAVLASQPMIRATPLAWLAFPDSLGAVGAGTPVAVAPTAPAGSPAVPASAAFDSEGYVIDPVSRRAATSRAGERASAATPSGFESLVCGAGAIVVESLTADLARRWQTIELGKRIIEQPDVMIALGEAQDAVLRGFMAACDKAKRRDLALFVIDAAAEALARGLSPMPIQLDPTSTMAVRAQARLAAGALLRGVTAWAEWDRQHRGVRFIDDDYAAAQLLLSEFERIQSSGVDRATAWLSELASLAPTQSSPGPGSAATVEAP